MSLKETGASNIPGLHPPSCYAKLTRKDPIKSSNFFNWCQYFCWAEKRNKITSINIFLVTVGKCIEEHFQAESEPWRY